MKVKYFVGIILAMQCVVSTTGHGRTPSCCLQTHKFKIRVTEMLNYLLQTAPPCPIKAVRFLLKNGKTLCSDPEDSWTQHAIKELDKINTTTPNNSPSRTFTSWTETTSRTSSPEARIEGTITMTTPKGTSTTWTPRTSITSRTSNKQPLGTTNKPSHWTTTQVTTMKMTTREPLANDIKTTSMTTTTESLVTTPKGTSTTRKPTTYITHTTSTTVQPVNTSKPPPWLTTTQLTTQKECTTMKMKPVTTETKTTSMTTTTENSVATTTPRRASPTERRVGTTNQGESKGESKTTTGKVKIPWTLRRLRKKSKKGLRRAQMLKVKNHLRS